MQLPCANAYFSLSALDQFSLSNFRNTLYNIGNVFSLHLMRGHLYDSNSGDIIHASSPFKLAYKALFIEKNTSTQKITLEDIVLSL